MNKNDITFDEWRAELDKLTQKNAEQVPEGWITLKQFAATAFESPISRAHATKLLKTLTEAGRTEIKNFTIPTGRKLYPVPHYKLKKK